MSYASKVFAQVQAANPYEPEFLQSVKEVFEFMEPVLDKNPPTQIGRASCRERV